MCDACRGFFTRFNRGALLILEIMFVIQCITVRGTSRSAQINSDREYSVGIKQGIQG